MPCQGDRYVDINSCYSVKRTSYADKVIDINSNI